MDNYNFWQDFFATYRSSPDAIKALWVIAPLAFMIALMWIVASVYACKRRPQSDFSHAFENSVHKRGNGQVLIFGKGQLLDRFDVSEITYERRANAES